MTLLNGQICTLLTSHTPPVVYTSCLMRSKTSSFVAATAIIAEPIMGGVWPSVGTSDMYAPPRTNLPSLTSGEMSSRCFLCQPHTSTLLYLVLGIRGGENEATFETEKEGWTHGRTSSRLERASGKSGMMTSHSYLGGEGEVAMVRRMTEAGVRRTDVQSMDSEWLRRAFMLKCTIWSVNKYVPNVC
jgi:hypothetical protein